MTEAKQNLLYEKKFNCSVGRRHEIFYIPTLYRLVLHFQGINIFPTTCPLLLSIFGKAIAGVGDVNGARYSRFEKVVY